MTDFLTTVIVGLFIVFLASVTSGLTGFGFALVSVPLLITFLPPRTVVPIVLLHSGLAHMVIALEARKWIDSKRIWRLIVAGVIGMALGTYLLIILSVSALKAFTGFVLVLSALAFLVGLKKQIENERLALVPVGFVSGLLGGSVGMSGPPVILFFANQGVEKQVFRANLAVYFVVLNLATITAYSLGGLMTTMVVTYAGLFLPALILGSLAGIRLAHRVEETLFRRVTLIVVIIAGLVSIGSGLGLL